MHAKPSTLVLASSSSYRQALLKRLGLKFAVMSPDVDETRLKNESPAAMVMRLAERKARAVSSAFPSALIIGSDQAAVLADQILGKPKHRDGAIAQLSAASGQDMTLLTALSLLNTETGRIQIDLVPFTVRFRSLSLAQIEAYVDREQPFDCAGSFKAESLGIALFEHMRGEDISSIEGLPLIRLVDMLKQEDVEVLA